MVGDIYEITDVLIRDMTDDPAEISEYAGCDTTTSVPEPIHCTVRVKRYKYEMTGKVLSPHASKNILIDHGIVKTTK